MCLWLCVYRTALNLLFIFVGYWWGHWNLDAGPMWGLLEEDIMVLHPDHQVGSSYWWRKEPKGAKKPPTTHKWTAKPFHIANTGPKQTRTSTCQRRKTERLKHDAYPLGHGWPHWGPLKFRGRGQLAHDHFPPGRTLTPSCIQLGYLPQDEIIKLSLAATGKRKDDNLFPVQFCY